MYVHLKVGELKSQAPQTHYLPAARSSMTKITLKVFKKKRIFIKKSPENFARSLRSLAGTLISSQAMEPCPSEAEII